ncbi:hypothetical protein BDZ45DRAFT_676854 [Acephala macrosclerotiorum]|nr:hypothetical protein BDZ45DRAFT_676854 [Acephala macrosclerotiorum]
MPRLRKRLSSFLVFFTSYHSGLEQQSDDLWLILGQFSFLWWLYQFSYQPDNLSAH